MQKSDWSVGHSKHRKAFGNHKRVKSGRFRLWYERWANSQPERKQRRVFMVGSIAELFGRRR